MERQENLLIIGFNGPPRSGKDTIAEQLIREIELNWDYPVFRRALAAPMRECALLLTGIPASQYNERKDEPLDILLGESVRQFMIGLSELFIKPGYGYDFWARSMAIPGSTFVPRILIVTDIGFQDEVEYLPKLGQFHLIQLARDGTDFSSDSRNYVGADNSMSVINNRTPEDAAIEIHAYLKPYLNELK